MRMATQWMTPILLGLAPMVALAGELPSSFTLGRYVPGDAWLYLHSVHNPERAWIDKQWSGVFDALQKSGIDRDITSLVLSLLPADDRAEAQDGIDTWTTLIQGVRWSELCKKEFVYAQRVGKTGVTYHYFVLARSSAASAEANMKGLLAILGEIAAAKKEFKLSSRREHGVTIWSLTFQKEGRPFPFSIELFRKGDVLGLSTGRGAIAEVTALKSGKCDKPAIVASNRFRESMR